MKQLYFLGLAGLLRGASAEAQDLTTAGATLTVGPGALLYVGTGGLSNQATSTLTNAGTLRVDGSLTNAGPATLDLNSGSLEVRGDFINLGTLRPGTSVVTFSGAADALFSPGGAGLYQVLVNKPTAGANTLRLTGDLTVSKHLSLLNGLVATQAPGGPVYTLRLPAGATLSGEAPGRYVLGTLQITRADVGGGAAVDFGHGAILNPQGDALGTVSITRTAGLLTKEVSFGTNLGNTTRGIDCIWTVAPTTQPAAPVQLTLSWLPDNDNGLTDFTQAHLYQQAGVGLPWTSVGSSADASSRHITTSLSVLARFTVSNGANLLPVRAGAPTPGAAGFVAYPTQVPAGQNVTYLYTGPAVPGTLRVLDLVGRTVRTVAVDGRAQGTVPLAGLPSGTYLLHYTTAAASFGERCMVE